MDTLYRNYLDTMVGISRLVDNAKELKKNKKEAPEKASSTKSDKNPGFFNLQPELKKYKKEISKIIWEEYHPYLPGTNLEEIEELFSPLKDGSNKRLICNRPSKKIMMLPFLMKKIGLITNSYYCKLINSRFYYGKNDVEYNCKSFSSTKSQRVSLFEDDPEYIIIERINKLLTWEFNIKALF